MSSQTDLDRDGGGSSRHHRRIWLSLLFVTLFAALLVVFFVLPKWQTGQQAGPEGPIPRVAQATPTPAQPTPLPTSLPSPTAATTRARPTAGVLRVPPPTRGPSSQQRAYADAMSEGLAALEEGRWGTARGALQRASELRPDAPEVTDAIARLEAGERRQQLAATFDSAGELESSEKWRDAEQSYAAVLAVDPSNAVALRGRKNAATRADLDEALAYHANHPGRMVSDKVLDEAVETLDEARAIQPRGPRLAEQIQRLEQVIAYASRPVAIVFESDNLTHVMVYKVGKLGTFSRHELALRPGTYTVVGSREGYRDVRLRVEVAPGAANKPIVVRCQEEL